MTVENGKVVIHAVHERDAKKFWESLELKDTEECFVCGKEVTWRNFGAVAPVDGEIKVICDELYCFSAFSEMRRSLQRAKVLSK